MFEPPAVVHTPLAWMLSFIRQVRQHRRRKKLGARRARRVSEVYDQTIRPLLDDAKQYLGDLLGGADRAALQGAHLGLLLQPPNFVFGFGDQDAQVNDLLDRI